MSESTDLTLLLEHSRTGDKEAWNKLFECVYPTMKAIVANKIKPYQHNVTLSTTDLVHDVYIRFDNHASYNWQNRAHFFSILARVSRRVIIDYLRSKNCEKRGGLIIHTEIQNAPLMGDELDKEDWLSIDRVLNELADLDPEIVELTELRFFVGLTLQEIADIKKLSLSSVKRQWRFAQAWLGQKLNEVTYA